MKDTLRVQRPTPIVVLAVLYFSVAVAAVSLVAVDFILRIPLWSAPFLILLAILQSVVGWGLWRLRSWARFITIILSAAFSFPSIAEIFGSFGSLSLLMLLLNLSFVTLQGVIIFYLMRASTRRVFEAPPMRIIV